MRKNKDFIEAVIRNKKEFKYSYRYASDPMDSFSQCTNYDPLTFDNVYHDPLIDCLKLKFRHTTIIINGLNSHKLRQ